MIRGCVLFSWDQKMGSVVETKYPENLDLKTDLINKIYMTFAYSQDFEKQELIDTSYNDKTIISYCDKTRVAAVGYEIVSIILEEKEKVNIFKLKNQLLEFGKNLFKIEKSERNHYFLENIGVFFGKTTTKKILLLGNAGTGKTSIKKIIFEGMDPKDLLYNPLEPTRGMTPNVYSWLDLKLGLFDSSGQELNFLLDNEDDSEHKLAFENTDYIVYIFDYPSWISQSREITDQIQKILKIVKKNSLTAKVIIFLHKIDLTGKEIDSKILADINKNLQKQFNFPIYNTSIHPDLIYSLYNAFYEILSSSSQETTKLKNILEDEVKNHMKSMFFISNLSNSIIVQTMSQDFNTVMINHTHKLIGLVTQTFEDMANTGNIDHLILSSYNNFNIIMNDINLSKFGLKYLICISETLTANKLILIIGQIRSKLKDFYYLNKEIES
ncbi:MAG: ADP-ribosylation factor-like protein [Promethearchaeia archaeon]